MDEELVPADYLLSPQNFERIFFRKTDYASLRQIALDGQLGETCNRFLSWRIFLGLLPEEGALADWITIIQQKREEYAELKASFLKVASEDLDPLINNPLSAAQENPWNHFHLDNQLKTTIRLDVDRTFQERALFRMNSIKTLLVEVLFAWAKMHPALGYKQGMNELLAILVFVAFCEKTPEHMDIDEEARRCLMVLNDGQCLEADVYWLFSRLMSLGIKELFNPVLAKSKPVKRGPNLFDWDHVVERNELVGKDKSEEDDASNVLKRCHRIHHRYLQAIDKELYDHLERQSIEPQMHLQRWLRCILSREFKLADTLVLWDAIFACVSSGLENRNEKLTGRLDLNNELVMLEFLCVSMIIFVRTFLLQSDSTGILQRLLKYPPVEDIRIIIAMAKRYQSYILGGCVTAKPSVLPQQVSAPAPLNLEPRTAPVFFASPLQPQKKPLMPDSLTRPQVNSPRAAPPQTNPLQAASHPLGGAVTEVKKSKFDRALALLQDQLSRGTMNPEDMREAVELLRQVKSELRI